MKLLVVAVFALVSFVVAVPLIDGEDLIDLAIGKYMKCVARLT